MGAALPNGQNGTFRFIGGAFVLCHKERAMVMGAEETWLGFGHISAKADSYRRFWPFSQTQSTVVVFPPQSSVHGWMDTDIRHWRKKI